MVEEGRREVDGGDEVDEDEDERKREREREKKKKEEKQRKGKGKQNEPPTSKKGTNPLRGSVGGVGPSPGTRVV